jgi:prepilin-type N-terminal cleavage/methylation domain-containing protein
MRARHRGYTLIECLVVVTLVGAVLSGVVVTVHALYRGQQRWADASVVRRAVERFVEQWRSDIHQARSVTVEPAADGGGAARVLSLGLPGEKTVRYRLADQEIERLVHRGDQVEHREIYPLATLPVGWQVRRDRGRMLVSLELRLPWDRRPDLADRQPTYQFTAAVGFVQPRDQ